MNVVFRENPSELQLVNLGCANDPMACSAIAECRAMARANGWQWQCVPLGRCYNRYECLEGGWYYTVDSSD